MDRIETLQGCVRTLQNIRVPMLLLEEIGVPIRAVTNTLNDEIMKMNMEKKQKQEGNADADDPVQREDAEPEKH